MKSLKTQWEETAAMEAKRWSFSLSGVFGLPDAREFMNVVFQLIALVLTLGSLGLGLGVLVFWAVTAVVYLRVPIAVEHFSAPVSNIFAYASQALAPYVGPLLSKPIVVLGPIAIVIGAGAAGVALLDFTDKREEAAKLKK